MLYKNMMMMVICPVNLFESLCNSKGKCIHVKRENDL